MDGIRPSFFCKFDKLFVATTDMYVRASRKGPIAIHFKSLSV